MYKHPHHPASSEDEKTPVPSDESSSSDSDSTTAPPVVKSPPHHTSAPADVRELMEKNLKWSQIIYEQNRRINRKLLWIAVSSWVKTLLIVAPLVIGLIFLPPFIRRIWESYSSFIQPSSGDPGDQPTSSSRSLDDLLRLLPLDSAQKEQLKTLLK